MRRESRSGSLFTCLGHDLRLHEKKSRSYIAREQDTISDSVFKAKIISSALG